MSTSHKFKDLADLASVYPEIPWQADAGGGTAIYDAKQETYVPVTKGQYVVSIGDRFEVHDEEPEKAKPAEAPKESKAKGSTNPKDEDTTGTSGIEGAEPVAAEK